MWDGRASLRKYQVEADSVADFIRKYYRPDRITDTLIDTYKNRMAKDGYTFISHHDSITGRIVSYYAD